MKLREEFEVAEPVASVWTFFEQPELVARCVPGVEQLTVVTPDDIDVRLTQSIGPMTATFAAKVTIVERVQEKLIGFTATGKSVRGAMGNVRANVSVQLEPLGDRTLVMVEGEVALAGALGSVGQKVVAKQAGKVTAQFARNLEAALGGDTVTSAGGPAQRRTPPRPVALPPVSDAAPSGFGSGGQVWVKALVALSAIQVILTTLSLVRARDAR